MAMVVTTGQCGNCYQCRNSYVNEEQETQSMCGSPSIAPCAIAEQTFCAGVEYSFTVGGNDYKANEQTCAVAQDKEIACAAARATVKNQFGDVGNQDKSYGELAALEMEKAIIENGGSDEFGAVILEPITAGGGVIPPPEGYFINNQQDIVFLT